jgi:hypothetical protein
MRYGGGAMRYTSHRHREPESRLADYLTEARAIMASPPPSPIPEVLDVSATFESLRWFWLPDEVAAAVR